MSILDLTCYESFYLSRDYHYNNRRKESLFLGQDYMHNYLIYLYFNLPPYSYLKHLKQARLILFKLPLTNSKNLDSEYSIFPLLVFLNIYCYTFSTPRIDDSRKIVFKDNYCYSYTDVDITCIINAWIKEEIENKGIILLGNEDSRLISYASNQYDIKGMQPMIRIIYDEDCYCQALSTIPCNINVI